MVNLEAGLNVKEQGKINRETSVKNGWHKQFQEYLEKGEFQRAKKYAERKNIERPLICYASYDFFMVLLHNKRKQEYFEMIDAFADYGFDNWIIAYERDLKSYLNAKGDRKT